MNLHLDAQKKSITEFVFPAIERPMGTLNPGDRLSNGKSYPFVKYSYAITNSNALRITVKKGFENINTRITKYGSVRLVEFLVLIS